jgi:hypothetical protein
MRRHFLIHPVAPLLLLLALLFRPFFSPVGDVRDAGILRHQEFDLVWFLRYF